MTVRELHNALRMIMRRDPSASDHDLVIETPRVWCTYHLAPGYSLRFGGGKQSVVIRWPNRDGMASESRRSIPRRVCSRGHSVIGVVS